MADKTLTIKYNADLPDEPIHKFAAAYLLSRYKSELILTQGKFSYRVSGGRGGYLYYKKGSGGKWVLIANWCFYGAYIVVRYRKSLWLRPMYRNLFARMKFTSITFDDYSIELAGTDGYILRSRRFRLSPPLALDEVMSEQFGLSQEQIEILKTELDLD